MVNGDGQSFNEKVERLEMIFWCSASLLWQDKELATPSKSTTEKSNMKTSATTTKSPTVSTKGSTMKTGWIHNGEYVTSIQGGGLKQVIVSGTETFQRLIELLSSAYKPTHDIKGVKLGKSTMEMLTEFTAGAKTLGEHIKKTRMVYSKMRVYVVTDDGCCTCSQDYPDFEMSFVRDDVTIHDPSSVLAHLALHRDLCHVQLHPTWLVSYLYSGHLPVGLYLGRGSLLLVGPLFHFRQCHSGLVSSRNERVSPLFHKANACHHWRATSSHKFDLFSHNISSVMGEHKIQFIQHVYIGFRQDA